MVWSFAFLDLIRTAFVTVCLADGTIHDCNYQGVMRISVTDIDSNQRTVVPMTDTLLVPGLRTALWSVPALSRQGHQVTFGLTTVSIVLHANTERELTIRLKHPMLTHNGQTSLPFSSFSGSAVAVRNRPTLRESAYGLAANPSQHQALAIQGPESEPAEVIDLTINESDGDSTDTDEDMPALLERGQPGRTSNSRRIIHVESDDESPDEDESGDESSSADGDLPDLLTREEIPSSSDSDSDAYMAIAPRNHPLYHPYHDYEGDFNSDWEFESTTEAETDPESDEDPSEDESMGHFLNETIEQDLIPPGPHPYPNDGVNGPFLYSDDNASEDEGSDDNDKENQPPDEGYEADADQTPSTRRRGTPFYSLQQIDFQHRLPARVNPVSIVPAELPPDFYPPNATCLMSQRSALRRMCDDGDLRRRYGNLSFTYASIAQRQLDEAEQERSARYQRRRRMLQSRRPVSLELMHRRFGHRSTKSILLAEESDLYTDLKVTPEPDEFCETCKVSTMRAANKGHEKEDDPPWTDLERYSIWTCSPIQPDNPSRRRPISRTT